MTRIRLRSAIPGRTRWEVEEIDERPELARLLNLVLRQHGAISYGFANPLTSRVLLQYDRAVGIDVVEQILRDALDQAKHRLVVARAAARKSGGAEEGGEEPAQPRRSVIARLFQGRSREVSSALGHTLLLEMAEGASPLAFGLLVELISSGSLGVLSRLGARTSRSQLLLLSGLNAFTAILEIAARYSATIRWKRLSQSMQHDLRIEIYNRIQTTDIAYREQYHSGKLSALLQNDIQKIELLGLNAAHVVDIAFWVVVVNGALWIFMPPVALINLVLMPVIAWGALYNQKRVGARYELAHEYTSLLSERLSSSLSGLSTIASFAAEDFEARRVQQASQSVVDSNQHAQTLGERAGMPLQALLWLGVGVQMFIGGSRVRAGKIPLSQFLTILILNRRMLWSLKDLGQILDHHQRVQTSARRIYDLLDTWPQVKDGHRHLPKHEIRGEIAFDDVSFRYNGGAEVFKNLSLRFPAGKMTAIVGATGAGKSTLVKLLLRFYDVDHGAISIDGMDVREIRLKSLRRAVALVPQDCFLFPGTIAENIAYGKPDADMRAIEQAARLAEAASFIEELSMGYATLVGERGFKLSGGQRQRIALARAIFTGAPILVLDEATSAVDNETEAAIQRSLERVTKGRTTVVIAHRLSTVRNADNIYVLNRGELCESGTHDELLEKNGIYADLWRFQIGESRVLP